MKDPRRRNRQLSVFLGSLLLVNFPALAIVDRLRLPDGVPLTPFYLFFVWLGMIALSALSVARPRS
ncbi:MAG: hypothetical protein WAS21_00120 [Geminicoccaceae bacterium]